MSVKVTLEFGSEQEAIRFLLTKTSAMIQTAPQSNPPGPAAVSHQEVAPAEVAKRGRGRPKKDATAADVLVVDDAKPASVTLPLDVANGDPLPESMGPAPAPEPEEPKSYTADEVKELMKQFSAKFGIDALRTAMSSATGFMRFSEVPADKYPALVSALKAEMTK